MKASIWKATIYYEDDFSISARIVQDGIVLCATFVDRTDRAFLTRKANMPEVCTRHSRVGDVGSQQIEAPEKPKNSGNDRAKRFSGTEASHIQNRR